MSDESPVTEPVVAAAPPPAARRAVMWRWTKRVLALFVALIATLLILVFSIDLGRITIGGKSITTLAEGRATKYFKRPTHIKSIKASLWPGEFIIEGFVIEGKSPTDRPFFKADKIVAHVAMTRLLVKNIVVDATLTSWHMVVEQFPDGTNNIPNLKPDPPKPDAKASTWKTNVPFIDALGGRFTYDDHQTPWSVDGPNLDVNIVPAAGKSRYQGLAQFTGGVVKIQQYEQMATDFKVLFLIDNGLVHVNDLTIAADGSTTKGKGEVDFGHWPEQHYDIVSNVHFPRMRDLFFAKDTFSLTGEGYFRGVFHLFRNVEQSKTEYSLKGDFTSPIAGVNQYRFPNFKGSLEWLPRSFVVSNAESDLYGGRSGMSYAIAPLGTPAGANVTFNVTYDGVDLGTVGRSLGWNVQPLGSARGRFGLTWPSGHFSEGRFGEGETVVTPPAGSRIADAQLPTPSVIVPTMSTDLFKGHEHDPLRAFGAGGTLKYRLDANGLDFDDSSAATRSTYINFRGHAGWSTADPVNIPFHVTSADAQESDDVLAGILTAMHPAQPTSRIAIGGQFLFDGTMTQSFDKLKIDGEFSADAMHAWDVTWGKGRAHLLIENGYLTTTNTVVTGASGQELRADGKFALGYPRADHGEEINAHVHTTRWPIDDFKVPFSLGDWPIEGVATADLTFTGTYGRGGLFGSGSLQIANGSAWKENFETATGNMIFEAGGIRIDKIEMKKGTGLVQASAWIGYDNKYSFNASGSRIAVESLQNFQYPKAPLTGVLRFSASGNSDFNHPQYNFEGTIADLFVGDEGIGLAKGNLSVHNQLVTIDSLEVASDRLQVSGKGQIEMNDASDAELNLTFSRTSIDPYLKLVGLQNWSPYTRAIASGSMRISGSLNDASALLVAATIDDAQLTLKDYNLENSDPIKLAFENNRFTIGRLKLKGSDPDSDTEFELKGSVDMSPMHVSLSADGKVNLAILQAIGKLSDISARGDAVVHASVDGGADKHYAFSGSADIQGGHIRYFSLPHSLENINGTIRFDQNGVNLDGVKAQMGANGTGDVQFGGYITMDGFQPKDFNVTATGTGMQVRYPTNFLSTVDAELTLRGPVDAPTLAGDVSVTKSNYYGEVATDLRVVLGSFGADVVAPPAALEPEVSTFPLMFDIHVTSTSIKFIERKDIQLVGRAEMFVRGTLATLAVTGRIDIDSGWFVFQGNQYKNVTGYYDLSNPAAPFFDISGIVSIYANDQGVNQKYNIDARLTGTFASINPILSSDPPLPMADILGLMLGNQAGLADPQQRALLSSQEANQNVASTFAAQIVTQAIAARIGINSVVGRLPIVDSVQFIPTLGYNAQLQTFDPGGHLVLGTQISQRAYLQVSQSLNSGREFILLTFDQNDRLSWVLSRNEDRTFALEFRIRQIRR